MRKISEDYVTKVKPARCWWCAEMIECGVRAFRWTLAYDGSLLTSYTHSECKEPMDTACSEYRREHSAVLRHSGTRPRMTEPEGA